MKRDFEPGTKVRVRCTDGGTREGKIVRYDAECFYIVNVNCAPPFTLRTGDPQYVVHEDDMELDK